VNSRMIKALFAGCLACAVVTGTAMAQGNGHGEGKGKGHDKHDYQRSVVGAHIVVFNRHTNIIVGVMRDVAY